MTHEPELRIAHFTIGRCNPESANGIDKTVYFVSRAQARLGHTVAVFSLTDKPALPIPGVSVATYAPRSRPGTIRPRLLETLISRSPHNVPSRLIEELIAWHPDVLHLHFVGLPQNVRLAWRAHRAGIPYCVTIHGGLAPAAQARNRWQKRLFALLVERRYLRGAAFLHATSPEDIEGLRVYGVSNETVLAPNGVDVDGPVPASDPLIWDTVAPHLRGQRILLFVGRLDPEQKGLDILLRGLARAAAPDTALVLVGPDWRDNRARLEALARTLGIGSRVAFAGPAFGERKARMLAAADLFVHTSRWEGLAFSVLEAAASGKPSLLTAPADPSGVFVRNGAALPVDASPESVSEGVRRFLALSAEELRAMGARARAIVERDFSWPPIARTLVAAYRTHALGAHG